MYDFSLNRVNTLPIFLKNVKKYKLQDYIEPIVMTSVDASLSVPDNLDLIFIDGSYHLWKLSLNYQAHLKMHQQMS